MIKPELTKTSGAQAGKSGSLIESGISGKAIPKVDTEMVDATKDVLKGAKTPLQATNNLTQGISDEATSLKNGLKATKTPWSVPELEAKLNDYKLPNSVKSDATLTNNFNNAKADILDLAKKADKTNVGGGLDVRQGFDQIIKDDFGDRIFDRTDGVSKIYKDLRNLLNDFVDDKLPDGKLDDGTSFKGSLRKQSLMFDARDNAAAKIKVGQPTTAIGKAVPILKKAAIGALKYGGAAVLGGEAVKHVIP